MTISLQHNGNPTQSIGCWPSCLRGGMYPMDGLRQCRGFDEDCFCYADRVDLGFRLRLLGHRAWYVPDAVVWQMCSATVIDGQHSDFATCYGRRNEVWVVVKNMPGAFFLCLLPLHFVFNIFSLLWLMVRRQGRIGLRAKWDALQELSAEWKKRSDINKCRRALLISV